MCFASRTTLALGLAAGLLAHDPANATIYVYDLGDHPGGILASTQDYGIRLDDASPPLFFSFDGASTATLTYDDTALTAVFSGTAIRNPVSGPSPGGDAWDLDYAFSGISDLGGGLFTATGGSGSISFGATMIDLLGKQMNGAAGFLATNYRGYSGISGAGWFMVTDTDTGNDDFLFTATPVPLPLPAVTLLSALAGLGLIARRRKRAG